MPLRSSRPYSRFWARFWESYVWLAYSLPYLFVSLLAPYPVVQKIGLLLAYVTFLGLYVIGQQVRGWRMLWIVGGFDVIAIAATPSNLQAVCFFIYGAAFLAYAFPTRTAFLLLVLQVATAGIAGLALDQTWWFYIPALGVTALIGAVTIQQAAKEAGDAKLRLAHDEVERLAQLAERERIARDLHDVLGHTLSVIVLKSELAQKLFGRDEARARQELADIERISRQGLADVREAITGYRATGLAAEIERVRGALAAAGISATVDARPVPLAAAQETALSLALREATTNVIRHAGAASCHIRFSAEEGSVAMEVRDDGRGGEAPFGNGLSGMRERVQALGGVLRRESEDGTRLLITLPLATRDTGHGVRAMSTAE